MKKFLLLIACIASVFANVRADEAKITFSEMGYENAQELTTVTVNENISLLFDKGTNTNTPKYYNSGTAARLYGGNTLTFIASDGYEINEIVMNTGSDKFHAESHVDCGILNIDGKVGTISNVNNNRVTLTQGGTSGHAKILDITITYGTAAVKNVETPQFSVEAGTYYEPQVVTITCATDGASIYYTTDGSTPDATKTLYNAPVTITSNTTLKAIAIKGEDTSNVQIATYNIVNSVANIATFIATNNTGAAMTELYRITGPVTVIYQYDRYMYLTDETATMLVYGDVKREYNNGDVLTNIIGSVGFYNDSYQMTPDADSFGEATPGTPVQPKTVAVNEVDVNMVNQYIRLKNVTVTAEATFSDANGNNIKAYKRFDVELPAVGASEYIVDGFVSIYKGEAQIYPSKITDITALEAVKAENSVHAVNGYIKTTGDAANVEVYNLTGKLIATGIVGNDIKIDVKGIYIVKVGNKATKVVVR